MRKESDIKKGIIQWLSVQPNTFIWQNHTTGIPDGKGGFRINYTKGIADICGVKKGRAFAFEVKAGYNKPTCFQMNWLEKFNKADGFAIVVRSLDEVVAVFEKI